MTPHLQVVKRSRPWSDEDLAKPLVITHPAAFKTAVTIHRSEVGDLDYYKGAAPQNNSNPT